MDKGTTDITLKIALDNKSIDEMIGKVRELQSILDKAKEILESFDLIEVEPKLSASKAV